MKVWDSRFFTKNHAEQLFVGLPKGVELVPFYKLNPLAKQDAMRVYPNTNVGGKYDFIYQHYYYPVMVKSGELYRGRGARRLLAIPYTEILNEDYMEALGYTARVDWTSKHMASELVNVAKELLGNYPDTPRIC